MARLPGMFPSAICRPTQQPLDIFQCFGRIPEIAWGFRDPPRSPSPLAFSSPVWSGGKS